MIIKIKIGQGESRTESHDFQIYENVLRQETSFFEIHGEPKRAATRHDSVIASDDDNVTVKPEDSESVTDGGITTSAGATDQPRTTLDHEYTATPLPDEKLATDQYHYHIMEKHHIPESWHMFQCWLMKRPVAVPKDKKSCRLVLQVYMLAIRYNVFALQNEVIDCLRQYHAESPVSIEDLIWVTNNTKRLARCPLRMYLTEQVAYEMAFEGIDGYMAVNENTWNHFLVNQEPRQQEIRTELFKILGRHAHAAKTKLEDPAKGMRNWHV